MKNAAIGLVLVSGLMLAIGLGMAYGLTDKYAAAGALAACPIWVPGLVFLASVPLAWYFGQRERRTSAQKFKTWCTANLGFAKDDFKVRVVLLDAMAVALDIGVISQEDAMHIFQDSSHSAEVRRQLRAELSDRIQSRLQSGTWNLKTADATRRRVIETFGYYKNTGISL